MYPFDKMMSIHLSHYSLSILTNQSEVHNG